MTKTVQNIIEGTSSFRYKWLPYFLLQACYCKVAASLVNVRISPTKHYAQSLLRCSVALNNSLLLLRLARSQSAYSESGPAVHFFLWITVHTPRLIPVQSGFTGAGRKRLIALTSLLKMWTNCKLWLSHVDVKEMWSGPHTSQLQELCVPVCVCECVWKGPCDTPYPY